MQQVFISGDARKSDGNFEQRNLHGSFFFPSGVVHGCLLMSFPEAGVERERERLGWRLERERGEVVKFYLAARALF